MNNLSDPTRRRNTQGRKGQTGQAYVWLVLFTPILVGFLGLTLDGGRVFAARRHLQNVADTAAHAGAQQLDEVAYRKSGGKQVLLDRPAASTAARQYGAGLPITLYVGTTQVFVRVEEDVPLAFLPLIGFNRIHIQAEAADELQHGVAGPLP